MVKNHVQVSFIELIETIGVIHHEEQIMSETFPFYPTYCEGNTIFLNIIRKGEVDPSLPLTPYKIVEVHHLLRLIEPRYETGTAIPSMVVYLRKIE